MPNRLIRDGFLDSESVNGLSDGAECLYHRLLLLVDDAGRFDARVGVLRARLYPLDTRRSAEEVAGLLEECERAGLLWVYVREGKPFLQVARWQRPGHSMYSKFPWKDGSYRVTWVRRESREGSKEYCATSLLCTPFVPSAAHPSAQSLAPTEARPEARVVSRVGEDVGGRVVGGGGAMVAADGMAMGSAWDADGVGHGISGDSFQMSDDEVEDEHEDVSPQPPVMRDGGGVGERVGAAPRAGGGEGVEAVGPTLEELERDWLSSSDGRVLTEDGSEVWMGGEGTVRRVVSSSRGDDVAPKGGANAGVRDGRDAGTLRGEFEAFWQVYPKKRLRGAAWRVWQEKRPPLADCLEAVRRLGRTEEWRKEGGRYVPHPANWLVAEGWADVPEVRRLSVAETGGSVGGGSRLLPGESVPKPLEDPEVWPDYVAERPELAGRHLRDLGPRELEAFKNWAFERQRREWEGVKRRG